MAPDESDGPVSGRLRRIRERFEGLKDSPEAAVEDEEDGDGGGRLDRARVEIEQTRDELAAIRDDVAASLPDAPEPPAEREREPALSETETVVAAVATGQVDEQDAAEAYGVAPETIGVAVDDFVADGDLDPETEAALAGGPDEYDVPFAFGPPEESMLFGPAAEQPDEQFDDLFDDRRWF